MSLIIHLHLLFTDSFSAIEGLQVEANLESAMHDQVQASSNAYLGQFGQVACILNNRQALLIWLDDSETILNVGNILLYTMNF